MNKIIRAQIASYPIDPVVRDAFEASLTEHIAYVREAGQQLGVPEHLLNGHDMSKWDEAEFLPYANWFKGDKNEPGAADRFAHAWMRHIHRNPHHWQHWIFPDGWTLPNANIENGVMEMPEEYALEMVADWMGASRAYTGSWDMTDWLTKNASKIKVHSNTNRFLCNTLLNHGYSDLVCIYLLGFGSKNIWE